MDSIYANGIEAPDEPNCLLDQASRSRLTNFCKQNLHPDISRKFQFKF